MSKAHKAKREILIYRVFGLIYLEKEDVPEQYVDVRTKSLHLEQEKIVP